MAPRRPGSTDPARYDGVTPRNAICPACAYPFGGVPIRGGTLTCPECGHVFAFHLPRPARRTRRWGTEALIWFVAVPGVGLAAYRVTGSVVLALAGVGVMALLSILLARLRRLAVPGH